MDCRSSYIQARFNEGPVSIFSSCMGMSKGPGGKLVKVCNRAVVLCSRDWLQCKEMVPIAVFSKFLSEDSFTSYRRWVLDSYVDCSGSIKFCPRPGCKFLVEYAGGGEREVSCRCGTL